MGKKTKALSGASQDAYFRRVLKAHPNLPAEERDRLVGQLRQDIAQLRLRMGTQARTGVDAPPPPGAAPEPTAPPAAAFDPFSPNVIVVVRKSGREAALVALAGIESLDHLRLLAREQRLTVPAEMSSSEDLRAAIVTAAERRIANRVAAAG
jgi:hypothetical protein